MLRLALKLGHLSHWLAPKLALAPSLDQNRRKRRELETKYHTELETKYHTDAVSYCWGLGGLLGLTGLVDEPDGAGEGAPGTTILG